VPWRAIGPDFRLTGLTIESRHQLPKAIQRFLAALDSIDCRMSSFGPSACEWCVCFVLNRIVSDMQCGPFAFLYNLSEGMRSSPFVRYR
jgi:hypothetical protein